MSQLDPSGAPPGSSPAPPSSAPFPSGSFAAATPQEWLPSLSTATSRRAPVLPRIAIALLVVFAGGLGAWWVLSGERDALPTSPAPIPAPMPESAPATGAPTLEGSDAQVRGWAERISTSPEWLSWMSGADLVRRVVGGMWMVSQGDSPRGVVPFLSPGAPFMVVERAGRIYASSESFARYERIARVVEGLDVGKLAAAWRALEPFFTRAHREIAPPGRTLQQTLDEATAHLLRTPVVKGDLQLVEKGAIYAYADPALEGLTPAQKHLLRMGPVNARAVQAKIREVREALGLAAVP